MRHAFTLEYWVEDGWYVGRLKEAPGVFSQAETVEELEENIKDAYDLVLTDEDSGWIPPETFNRQIEVEV
ncbi:MAG: type II toxin-antitoxin system HicB family antitoxin [Thermoanaerobaculales bacterium]|nr:type II toxin-antitoxin system HicB family antitoxin [Thermoanaerobaculales bacterium]